MKQIIDLRKLATELSDDFPAIDSLWLFGSRRYRTRSVRSDIDLLVCTSEYLKPSDLRSAIRRRCPALDLFLVTGGKAVSCMNESFVEAESFDALRSKLDAICVWSSKPAEVDATAPFEQEIRADITYVPTALDGSDPRIGNWGQSVLAYFDEIRAKRLPTKPFLGETVDDVASFLVEVCAGMIATCERLISRKTRAQWRPSLESEYDLQDAFFLVMKPWLPDLTREELLLRFDEQEKLADFSLLEGRIAIEIKYIYDKNTKAGVAKTLDGLSRFYGRNPRVEALLFLVVALPLADVDAGKWASEFSRDDGVQKVLTRVFQIKT